MSRTSVITHVLLTSILSHFIRIGLTLHVWRSFVILLEKELFEILNKKHIPRNIQSIVYVHRKLPIVLL
jgi:hypothetical protein